MAKPEVFDSVGLDNHSVEPPFEAKKAELAPVTSTSGCSGHLPLASFFARKLGRLFKSLKKSTVTSHAGSRMA